MRLTLQDEFLRSFEPSLLRNQVLRFGEKAVVNAGIRNLGYPGTWGHLKQEAKIIQPYLEYLESKQ